MGSKAILVLASLLVTGASCSENERSYDGVAKDGSASDVASAATDLCMPPGVPAAPVVFRFVNTTSSPLFYYLGCFGPEYSVSSAASGFTDELAPRIFCPCSCGNPPMCSTCGQCYDNGFLLGREADIMWDTQSATPHSCSGQACVAFRPLSFGQYRLTMSFYGSEVDAVAHKRALVALQKDFDYSAAGQVVIVEVNP